MYRYIIMGLCSGVIKGRTKCSCWTDLAPQPKLARKWMQVAVYDMGRGMLMVAGMVQHEGCVAYPPSEPEFLISIGRFALCGMLQTASM
jgi:hypothetical protein